MAHAQYDIEVVARSTGKVVSTVDCRGKNLAALDKIESGMWINMDHDRYYTRRVKSGRAGKGTR